MKNTGKKFFLSLAVVLGFTGYVFRQRHGGDDARAITANPSTTSQTTPDTSNTNTSTDTTNTDTSQTTTNTDTGQTTNTDTGTTNTSTTPTPTPTPTPVNSGQYKNGSYTGSVADAFYGNIQVRVKISGGKITDVVFLQYPNDRNTSVFINSQAMPLLKQEAIQAQSANVSGVSGASASSGAFIQSLQSALDQARA